MAAVRNKAGILCMTLGVALLLGALGLFLHNQREETAAEEAVVEILPQVVERIRERQLPVESVTELDAAVLPQTPEEIPEMDTVEVNGRSYIGYLSIPALNLELPVQSGWDYRLLKNGPCLYAGNLYADDLVIMAHNYNSHFGQLTSLTTGDRVIFVDANGSAVEYEVVVLEVLGPSEIEEMTSGEYDLTLFTCTYGGAKRTTIRCDRME